MCNLLRKGKKLVFMMLLCSGVIYELCSHAKVRLYDCVLHHVLSFSLSLSVANCTDDDCYCTRVTNGNTSCITECQRMIVYKLKTFNIEL